MESTCHLSSNLASLSATLTSISNLHSQTNVTDSQSNLQPFTCAILNSYNLDITEFIRDAEQLEQNLFWVPPRPGTTKDDKLDSNKHQSQSQTAVAVDEELELGANILMPRNPERRQPVPPTPLRHANRSKADGRSGNVAEQNGAKTLLLAAQKLVDNYIPTPRARKHIKQLLRRQTELQSSFSKLDRHASILEETISRGGRAPSDFNSNNNRGSGDNNNDKPSSAGSSQESQRLKRLREELQKEEMEVMALEEMEKELQREIRKNKALASAGASSASSGVGGSRTSSTSVKKSTAEGSSARPSVGSRPSVGTRPSPSASSSRPSGSSSSPSNTVKRVSSGSTTTTARRSVSGSTSTNTPPAKARNSVKSQDTTPKKKVSQPVKPSAISKDTSSSPQTKETEEVVGDTTAVPEPKKEAKEVKESEVQEEEEREEEPTVRLAPPSQVEDEQEVEGTEENLLEEDLPEEANKVEEAVDQYASPYTLPIPKPTDELERISELIWNTFPDLLRSSSLPNSSSKEIADFKETLLMIDSLANPPPSSSNGDISMSEDGTVITTSSTSSTTSSNFGPPASHTPTNTIFCLILSSLLRSPEPHQVEFPFLKQLSHLWWDREGKDIFVEAYPPNVREEDINLDESGTAMATRAVYSMAGKKLAFPKRTRDGSHKVLFGTGLQ